MQKFYHHVDKRSRKDMTQYLINHFRYDTMNSWNQATSYACNLKIYNLGLEREITDKLYDLIGVDEFYEPLRDLMQDFGAAHGYEWQAGMNGRSGGYLVLYQGGQKPSEYKSFCTACGQKNYRSTAENGIVCGACGRPARQDFTITPMQVFTYPGRGTDMNEDFEDYALWQLRDRVELIQSFDRLADLMVQEALYMARHYSVEKESIMVQKERLVLVPSA